MCRHVHVWLTQPAQRSCSGKVCSVSSVSPHTVLQLEINDVTRAWGLEVVRVELAVEAVLQLPQDSPLQQLAPHLLGVGMSSVAGYALPQGQGEEPPEKGGDSVEHSAWCPAQAELCYLLP